MNMTHPERRQDETFLGNADDNCFASCGWKSKRRGSVAYDTEGNVIPPVTFGLPGMTSLLPLFAKTDEIKAKFPELWDTV